MCSKSWCNRYYVIVQKSVWHWSEYLNVFFVNKSQPAIHECIIINIMGQKL